MWAPVEVLLGCLLSNSSQILEVSMFLPMLDGSCGRVELWTSSCQHLTMVMEE